MSLCWRSVPRSVLLADVLVLVLVLMWMRLVKGDVGVGVIVTLGTVTIVSVAQYL
jgi:hypothetical protein